MTAVTVGKLAEWIIENRRGGAFCGYSIEKVFDEIMDCSETNTLMYYLDEKGEIVGVAMGRRDEDRKRVHVYDVLATMPGVVRHFVLEFINRFPGYTITGTTKTGRNRHFTDIHKLYRKL